MQQSASARYRQGAHGLGYSDYEHQAVRQAAGLDALTRVGADGQGVRDAPVLHPLPSGTDGHHRGDDGGDSDRRAAVVPAREGRPGSLAHDYDIPDITFRPRRWLVVLPVVAIAGGSFYLHRAGLVGGIVADPVLLATWIVTALFILIQLVLAWFQKPMSADRRQQQALDELFVTVVIPCYNEDPQILDRTIVSLMRQTRLPDHVEVVDDGSTVDYTEVREFWLRHHAAGVRFTWVRQRNAGKKHAQAVTFTSDRAADIFVTIDSDSALERRALDEGLKPFADPRVVSVAGLETAMNIDRNLLTRAIGHRSLAFQLFAMSAQSVARGSVLINPGAFSLYWAPLIRKIVPAYLGETFFGVPVTLGDDTALTMFALLHGRAVHQPSAISLPVYPESLAHHLRQWTRWMRASTIRMLWRIRYLPVLSYGWIFTVYTVGAFLTSVAVTVAIPLAWPATEHLLVASLAAMVVWPLSISLRLATVRRSDQGTVNRLIGVALLPAAALWYMTVLRQIRFYGIATCWRQGWVTRQQVEVRLDGSRGAAADSPAPAEPRVPGGQPAAAGSGAMPNIDSAGRPGTRQRPGVADDQRRTTPAPADRRDAWAPRAALVSQRNGPDAGPAFEQWSARSSQPGQGNQRAYNHWDEDPWRNPDPRPAQHRSDHVNPRSAPDTVRGDWAARDPRARQDAGHHYHRDPRIDEQWHAQGPWPPQRAASARDQAAWDGRIERDPRVAWDGATARDPRAAWDGATARDPRAAWDGATARDPRAAWDGATARDPRAAWDGATARDPRYGSFGPADQNGPVPRDPHIPRIQPDALARDRQNLYDRGVPYGVNGHAPGDGWAALHSHNEHNGQDQRRGSSAEPYR